jgi:hypothetical protein
VDVHVSTPTAGIDTQTSAGETESGWFLFWTKSDEPIYITATTDGYGEKLVNSTTDGYPITRVIACATQ